MSWKLGDVAGLTLSALLSGCITVLPPASNPAAVQYNFNVPAPAQPGAVQNVERGAISGKPQHVGFFYAVNPDCTLTGLVTTMVKTPALHGSVTFAKADGYPNFPLYSDSRDCNKRKFPGVEVLYTSNQDYSGPDQFTVQGVGPLGRYLETHYLVKVIAP
jgi:hypothetical protein